MDYIKEQALVLDALKTFVTAWENGETSLLDRCVEVEPYIYFSPFGKIYTREELKKTLIQSREKFLTVKMQVLNHVCRIKEKKAQQYASWLAFITGEGEKQLALGGSFVNTLIRNEEGWKMHTMRFDLQMDSVHSDIYVTEEGYFVYEKGSGTYEVVPTWKTVNDRVGCFMDPIAGQGNNYIVGETDAPWYAMPDAKGPATDEEKLRELFAQYCFAQDFNTFSPLADIMEADAVFVSQHAGVLNLHDAIAYLKIVRQGAPRSFHAGNVVKIEIKARGKSSGGSVGS